MTQEEKARRFDEVLAMAKDCITYIPDDAVNQYMLDMFPELKESEGEKIRKVLIGWINLEPSTSFNDTFDGFSKEQILAWLKKQGEQKPIKCNEKWYDFVRWFVKERTDNYTLIPSDTDIHTWGDIILDHAKKELEKQSEEKPTDKVEPKFHEGDWIIFAEDHNSVYQVERIDNYRYYLRHYLGGTLSVHFDNELIRHWTIQDAKDGDVLAAHECYVIFKEIDGLNIKCYCTYHYMGFNPSFYVCTLQNKEAFHPATKEQREQLEKAMADAGFTFDKKGLKKIEHDVQLTEFEEAVKDLMNDYRDAIGDNDATIEEVKEHAAYMLSLIHQNFAWSKEDNEIIEEIINDIECARAINYHAPKEGYEFRENWLKSLKGRYTWKPTKDQIDALFAAVYLKALRNTLEKDSVKQLEELYNQLKKLKME